MSTKAKPKARKLLKIVTGVNYATGIIDAGTGSVTFSHGIPRAPKMSDRQPIALTFVSLVSRKFR